VPGLSVTARITDPQVAGSCRRPATCRLLKLVRTAATFAVSVYRAHHSTEPATTKLLADISAALDSGNLTMLTLLDLSAAFDTVDHKTLLPRLDVSFGLSGRWSHAVLLMQHIDVGTRYSYLRSFAGVGPGTDPVPAYVDPFTDRFFRRLWLP